jgi:hypothetical protein
VAERNTVPPNNLVAGSSVVCGFFAVVPHLAGRGGEVCVVVLLSACRGGEGDKLFVAPSSAHRRCWMWRDLKSTLSSGRLESGRARFGDTGFYLHRGWDPRICVDAYPSAADRSSSHGKLVSRHDERTRWKPPQSLLRQRFYNLHGVDS